MRLIASQIPETVGRLVSSGRLKKPPTWYNAVLHNPPPRIAPRHHRLKNKLTPTGEASDERMRQLSRIAGMKAPRFKPGHLRYREDEVRRTFFQDFPFEALRPTTLLEMRAVGEEHPISGSNWTSLAQRGSYPTVEDTIAYVLKIHDEGVSMSNAYKQATDEFVKLRARYEMVQIASELEARHYGAEFNDSPIERHFKKEREYLDSHLSSQTQLPVEQRSIKWKPPRQRRWTTYIVPSALPQADEEFSGGRDYVTRWKAVFTPPPPEPVTDAIWHETEVDIDSTKTESGETQAEDGSVDNFQLMRQSIFGGSSDVPSASSSTPSSETSKVPAAEVKEVSGSKDN